TQTYTITNSISATGPGGFVGFYTPATAVKKSCNAPGNPYGPCGSCPSGQSCVSGVCEPAMNPKGYHDSSVCSSDSTYGWINGWTCDPDNYNQAIDVHFYKDGPAGVGTFMGSVSANQAREAAVGAQCGGNPNHGFSFQFSVPSSMKDGLPHPIYAYAIDIPITTGLTNPLLGNSPIAITCSAPVCTPATCASLGKNCGSWSDGCGGTLNCGSCSIGYICSSGTCVAETTPPSVTGSYSPSSPSTSDTITFSASASDASGIRHTGVLVVGTGSYTCGGSSCSHSWGPFSTGTYTFTAYAWDDSPNNNYGYTDYNFCVRKISCSAGKNCGTESDNCGGTINCGSCSGGQVCYIPSGSTSGTCTDPHWVATGTDLTVCPALECQYPSGCNADGTCAYSCSAVGTSCTSGKCYSCSCDTSPPVTSISLSPAWPNGANGWYVSSVSASITCSDVGSGCQKITYTTNDGANWYDASASSTPFTYTINLGDGTYYVKAYSTDKATLVGSTVSAPISPIKVDTVAPSVSVTGAPASWQRASASAGVSCSDSLSGCDSGTYKLKTYSSSPGSCSNTCADYALSSPSAISSHVWVCAAAKDNAGNAGFSSPVEFLVDQIPPQVNPYGIPFSPCDKDPAFLSFNADPAINWIDCSATASLSTSGSKGCQDADSGCNPSSYGFIKYYAQPASCPSAKSSYSSKAPQLENLSWVCGYAEDNVGNAAVSGPTKFMVNRTFVIEINALAYGEIEVPAGTEVKGYLCDPSQYYCNQDAAYLAGSSGIVGADKRFRITFVRELVRGTIYKVGLQTEKGYAESEFIA
ncbi:MAG: hypothetical protein KKB25_03525, partial [Nanoarchaeota archaeon]|nr:hypothetical protein [Nanoarchaeota archaeon]